MKTYCLFFFVVIFKCNVVSGEINTTYKKITNANAINISLNNQEKTGFSLSDSSQEFTIRYRSVDNLIILPVVINDSISANLILDTGCRNVVLFGKHFQKLLNFNNGRIVEFSGLGSGYNVKGKLSTGNRLSIGRVEGHSIPIIVVPERNVFSSYKNIHGLIGYDIFFRFEIEIQPSLQLISFRPALNNRVAFGYTKIPMEVVDLRPMLRSKLILSAETLAADLLIDTGSALGLVLKSSDESKFEDERKIEFFGKGLNGPIKGICAEASELKIGNYELTRIPVKIIYSCQSYGSVGMDVLKQYSIIINYARAFVGLKSNSKAPEDDITQLADN